MPTHSATPSVPTVPRSAWSRVYVLRGEMTAAIETIRDLIVRATRVHDLMSKIIGLFELTFVLAFRGDGPGARARLMPRSKPVATVRDFVER